MPNANTIDERVVEMRINNRQFVKGANNTISVLDRLKDALSFKKASKGFEDISKAANKVDLGGLTDAINSIDSKLEYLGSKTRMMMENIIHDIYGKAQQFITSVTTDQITAGWSKYEDITSSIHTIMGATASNWEQTLERIYRDYGFIGTQMDYVSSQMEKLNWFTDETSASLTDMVNNIGKFTNAGVELDQAIIDMMGISTWGYKSGATINEISRAMYNLSQAMALGSVRLMDWRSIENANMATIEFKQTVLDTAVELGTLQKVSDGVYKTIAKGTEVTATNFSEALSEGWFNSDVLQASLYEYGHFANVLSEVTNETDVSTRDLLDMVEDYKNGVFDAKKWQDKLYQSMGANTPSVKALDRAMELLGQEEDDLGYKAFLASQETKTLTEAIEYTKDAVSSGWMKTWEYVFGNYEEAKEFWSSVTDELYELFVKAGERRNAILSFWKEKGGRDDLIEALWNVYDAIMNMVSPIKKAFKTIFGLDDDPEKAGKKLADLTKKFKEFTERLVISEDTLKGMEVFFTKFFEKVKVVLSYLKKALSIFGKVFGFITRIFGAFFRAWSSGTFDANQFLTEMNEIIGDIGKKLKEAWEKVKQFVDGLQDIPVVGPVLKFIYNALDKIWKVFGWIIDKIKGIKVQSEGVDGPWNKIRKVFEDLWDRIKSIDIDTQALKDTFAKVSEFVSTVWEGLVGDPGEFKKKVKNFFSNAFQGLVEAVKEIDFAKLLQGAKIGVLTYIGIKFAGMIGSMKRAVDTVQDIPQSISGVFVSIQDTFRSLSRSIQANIYIKIAIAIGILAASIAMLSQIDDNKFVLVALTLVTMFALLAKAAKSLEKMDMFSNNSNKVGVMIKGFSKTAMMIIAMAAFLAAATFAIKEVASLSFGDIIKGLGTIAIIILLAGVAMKLINKEMSDDKGNLKAMLKLASIAAIISAAGKAIATLAKLPIAGVIIGAAAIGIVVAAMALVINQATKFEKTSKSAIALIGMLVLAIYALTLPIVALALLAKTHMMEILYAVGIIGLLMLLIAAFVAIGAKIGEMPGLQKFAIMLMVIAGAMLLFAIATAIMVPAVAALIGILALFIATLMEMETGEFAEVTRRLALIGVALLPLAIVLAIVSASLFVFGLGILAAGLGVNMFVKAILKFAISIALIGVAIKFLVDSIAKVIETVSKYGDQFVEVLEWILMTVIGLFIAYKMYIANAALTIVLAVITVISNVGGGELIKLLHTLLDKVFLFIGEALGTLVDFLVGFIVYALQRLADALEANRQALAVQIEKIVGIIISLVFEVAIRLIGDLLQLLLGGIPGIGDAISKKFSEVARGVGDYISSTFDHTAELEEAGLNAGGTFAQRVADGTKEEGGSFADAVKSFVGDGNKVIDDNNTENAPILGGNFDIGVANGIEEHIPDVIGSIDDLTGAMTGRFQNNLDMHSPSKVGVSMGRFWDLGIAFGVRDNLGEVTEANDELTKMMTSALMTAMGIVGRIADEDLSIKPVVKPVVDMSDVSSASSMVSGMFGNYGAIDVGAINGRVSEAVDSASAAASSMDAFGNVSSSNDSFVINVYSQPGMDENELANAVMYKIQNGIIRKGAALG